MLCSRSPRESTLPPSSRVFPYRAVGLRGIAPAIPLVLHGPKNRINHVGLVDSGADSSLLPVSIAAFLGIDLSTCQEEPMMGAGGQSRRWSYLPGITAELRAMSKRFPLNISFAEHVPIMLLGRSDFFATFRVTVDERAETVKLDAYD